MGHFAKLSGLVGLAAILAAPAPAFAAARSAGFAFRPVQGMHGAGRVVRPNGGQPTRVGADVHRGGYAGRRGFRHGFGGGGYGYGYGGYGYGVGFLPWEMDQTYYPAAPAPYPADYGDGSGEPAYGSNGYGVVYNFPPTPPLWYRRPGPRIIYLSGRHLHRRHGHVARGHGVTVVRGGDVSVE